jgi:hypothetical protein
MAIAATRAQNQVTDQGDVVVPTNGVIAARAMRAGKNNRLPPGQPRNADIQKAAENQAEEPNDDIRRDHAMLLPSRETEARKSKFETRQHASNFDVLIFECRP